MDTLSETAKDTSKETLGFFKYVFDFNNDNKNAMLNMLQYTVLSIIPLFLVLKVTKNYVPEVDEYKGSLEILAESLFQIVFIVLSFWFINRIIFYIPTYSGENYKDFNEITYILSFVFILLTLQTKLGDKLRILSERVMELWSGENNAKNDEKAKNIKVSQPLSHQPSQADYLGSMPPMMPPPPPAQMTNMKSQTNEYALPKQTLPDYNQMYMNQNNPLVGAAQPGIMQEPMAANEGFGAFGSAF
jgi:hypothetical protein